MPNRDDRVMEFSELLQSSRSRVFGLIYAIVLNMADAEDLFQQTAALLWEKFDEYQPGTDFAAWALRVARFNTANFTRSRTRERRRMTTATIDALYQTSIAGCEENDERLEALKSCLTKLKADDRELVTRCYDGGAQIAAIAEQEGKTAGALYAALHRIRRSLLDCINRTLAAGDRPAPNSS